MKKSFFLIAAMLVLTTFAMGQTTTLIVDNQSSYDVHYVLYGDNGVCDASSQSGTLTVSANTFNTYTDPSVPIAGLSSTDVFTMFGLYSSDPSSTTPCGTATLQGYYTGCGAQGYTTGPYTESIGTPFSSTICTTANITVEWQNNTPVPGISTVLIQ